MNYVSQAQTPKPAALLGAVAIPLGVGALLATSLAVQVFVTPEPKNPIGVFITPKPIDPPPPPPQAEKQETVTEKTVSDIPRPDIIVPDMPITLTQGPPISTGEFELPDIVIPTPGSGSGKLPVEKPAPIIEVIAATPQNNPGGWITEGDYRTRWINEGLAGVANFNLEVGTNGRVTKCTITRSTGHAVLDGATCRLIERRARFKPARNGAGDKVAGVYSSSISWEIPD